MDDAPTTDCLTDRELRELVERVFAPTPEDLGLAMLVDLPHSPTSDTPPWRNRRELARAWAERLAAMAGELGLKTDLYLYPRVASNNADLPSEVHRHRDGPLPSSAAEIRAAGEALTTVFDHHSIVIAITELSATAPLKIAAPRHRFRAVTMPGFSRRMIPALRLDWVEIDRRVRHLKRLLDRADTARIAFRTAAGPARLTLDLRHRAAHASGGLATRPGIAGNLPSGETYIVPYEGEKDGDPSRSEGLLPVQLGDEVVIYRIARNRAVQILSEGEASRREAELLGREPAYGNLAELGFGVLGELGVEPVGRILLDEKLGLHIAFGRSEHFGGQVGAGDFTCPEAVVHIDRVYLEKTQPAVEVPRVDLEMPGGAGLALMRDGRYAIDFTDRDLEEISR